MPRGKKSKIRAREKRRQVQDEAQELKDLHATATEKGESPSCSDQASGDAVPSTSAGLPQKSQGMVPTPSAGKGMAHRRSDKGAKGKRGEKGNSSTAPPSTAAPEIDLLSKKAGMLLEYMMHRYKINQPIKKGEMLKVVNKRFKQQFSEILKKAIYHLDLVFGLELKELQPNGQSYMVVSKLDFQDDGSKSNELGVPNRGILIPLLSVIYLYGYCASEEEVWDFLNMLGVYDGVSHIIFGDIRKLITKDLVQENYLEYRQVADSDPPRFEFLWGLRAYTEASMVKVMEFLKNITENMPSVYSARYEKFLKEEEEEKAQAEAASQGGTKSKCKGHSKGKSSHPT
ncbi:melanoma-associated antigen B4-like [Nannospalax galili]|uniref:melanoma-associated antigen B4-like n=1 Tax=Nannospalax galili TaxID=1026970 RepID=UPI0004ED5C7C|nr:melanoma-associated antigen B4-like [Nannospalax galili]